MALRSAPLLLLVLVTVAVRESCFGTSSHSLKYFSTAISEPSQGQPHFIAVGYLDGQVFVRYDSKSHKMKPQVSWMEKVGKDDPQYWEGETQRERVNEKMFRENLEILRNRYNQSEGLHTLQRMYGCELCADGTKGGFWQDGYEGRTFIVFDPETLTWVGPDPQAQITQRKWDADSVYNQRNKAYLEEICIEWLKKYLSYKMETLQRTETPKVTVSSRTEVEDGMETHVCQVHGFYPREIDASWTRDGEVWLQDTLHASVAPNADGTYHHWLSIQIDPKERDRYRCHVEHDGLQEPLDMALKEPRSNLGLIIGCVVAALIQVCVIAGILVFLKRRQGDYNRAPKPTNSNFNLGIIIGFVVAALVLGGVIAGILVFFKRRQDDYKAAPTSDKGSNSSDQEPRSNLGLIIGCVVAALILVCVIAGIQVFLKIRQGDYNRAPMGISIVDRDLKVGIPIVDCDLKGDTPSIKREE